MALVMLREGDKSIVQKTSIVAMYSNSGKVFCFLKMPLFGKSTVCLYPHLNS